MYKIKEIYYYIEIGFSIFLKYIGIKKNTSYIPKGVYCYVCDEEKNKKEPLNGGFWIKHCKYYRKMRKNGYAACTFVGFIGWDIC